MEKPIVIMGGDVANHLSDDGENDPLLVCISFFNIENNSLNKKIECPS
jgi:hypothetical protein